MPGADALAADSISSRALRVEALLAFVLSISSQFPNSIFNPCACIFACWSSCRRSRLANRPFTAPDSLARLVPRRTPPICQARTVRGPRPRSTARCLSPAARMRSPSPCRRRRQPPESSSAPARARPWPGLFGPRPNPLHFRPGLLQNQLSVTDHPDVASKVLRSPLCLQHGWRQKTENVGFQVRSLRHCFLSELSLWPRRGPRGDEFNCLLCRHGRCDFELRGMANRQIGLRAGNYTVLHHATARKDAKKMLETSRRIDVSKR